MIDRDNLYKQNRIHTLNGEDRWIILAYCPGPSVTMVNLNTGRRDNFGLGGLTDQSYIPTDDYVDISKIEIPKENE